MYVWGQITFAPFDIICKEVLHFLICSKESKDFEIYKRVQRRTAAQTLSIALFFKKNTLQNLISVYVTTLLSIFVQKRKNPHFPIAQKPHR
jgi:hypothetical protein